ncbi:MAG: hypothetical protein ACOCVF_02190 [bacterium]
MTNFIKLHLSFVFNQLMIITIVILELICLSGIIYASNIINGFTYMDSFRNEFTVSYINDTFIILEVIIVIIAIFSATILQSKSNNYLMSYTTYSKIDKLFFIIAKIIVGILLIGILLFFNYLMFNLINKFTPYQIDNNYIMKTYFYLFIEAMQMFAFTLALLSVINHIFISIIPITLFWYLETIINNHNKFNDFLLAIFININPYINKKHIIYIPLLIILIILLNYIFITYKKDCF